MEAIFLLIIISEAKAKTLVPSKSVEMIHYTQTRDIMEESNTEDTEEATEEEEESIETIIQETEEPSLPYRFAEEEERVEMFSIGGYYRGSFFSYSGLPEVNGPHVSHVSTSFLQSRFRLEPTVTITPSVRVRSQLDVLDDVLWGKWDKGFSVGGELTCDRFYDGRNIAECRGVPRVVAVKRLWGEIDSILSLPVKVKVGKQPVSFGLGAHMNDGNYLDALWGDAHLGTTRDRLSVLITLSDSGLEMEGGVESIDVANGVLRGYFISPRYEAKNLLVSFYADTRRSERTEMYSVIPYLKFSPAYNISAELEGGVFAGNVDYIPVLPRYKVLAWNLAGNLKILTGMFRFSFDAGYSSGDDNPSDDRLTSIPMHPDFNVGFILYEDILARYTGGIAREVEISSGRSAEFFASKGGVFGSYYFMPTVGLFPFESVGAYLSTLVAFSNHALFVDPRSGLPFFGGSRKKGLMGVELDLGLKVGTENLDLSLQLGYAILGNAIKSAVSDELKNTFKMQFRFTFMF